MFADSMSFNNTIPFDAVTEDDSESKSHENHDLYYYMKVFYYFV